MWDDVEALVHLPNQRTSVVVEKTSFTPTAQPSVLGLEVQTWTIMVHIDTEQQ